MATRRLKKKGASKQEPTRIEGVLLEKVDESRLAAAYAEAFAECGKSRKPPFKLPAKPKNTVQKVEMLAQWYRNVIAVNNLCGCTVCGGDSSEDLDACPFCGEQGVVDEALAPVAPPSNVEADEPAPKVEVVEKAPPPKPAKKYTTRDLDRQVQKVHKLKASAAVGIWDLGRAIREIFESGTWMLREAEDSKVAYRNFKQFCAAELEISYAHAHRLMAAAQAFTKAEMEEFGTHKCRLILTLPPEKRAGLLEAAKGGATRAQLSAEVERLKGKERPTPPKGALTLAMAPGRVEIPLLARPKGDDQKQRRSNEMKRAKNLGDDPWAVELLANDVKIFYGVTRDKTGNMVLIVDRRRAKADEVFGASEEE